MPTRYVHYTRCTDTGTSIHTDTASVRERLNLFKQPFWVFEPKELAPDNPLRHYTDALGEIQLDQTRAVRSETEPIVWSLDIDADVYAKAYTVTTDPEPNRDLLVDAVKRCIDSEIAMLESNVRLWRERQDALVLTGTPTETVYLHTFTLDKDGFHEKTTDLRAVVIRDDRDDTHRYRHPRLDPFSGIKGGRHKQTISSTDMAHLLQTKPVTVPESNRGAEHVRIEIPSLSPTLSDADVRACRIALLTHLEWTLFRMGERHHPFRYYVAFDEIRPLAWFALTESTDPMDVCAAIGHEWDTYAIPTSLFGGTNEVEQAGTCIRCKCETHDRGHDTYV